MKEKTSDYDLNIFKDRKPGVIGSVKKSAVNILLIEMGGQDFIIFERRAARLKSQPGDISLPGGKMDEGETPKETAQRELFEELGIDKSMVEYIGENDIFISPYSHIVHSFIGRVKTTEFKCNEHEVDELIFIPLEFFMNNEPSMHMIEIKPQIGEDFPYDLINNGKNYPFMTGRMPQYFYVYNETTVWGFTARIIKNFIDILRKK